MRGDALVHTKESLMRTLTSSWRAFGSTAFDEALCALRGSLSEPVPKACDPLVLRFAGTPSADVLAFARRCAVRAVAQGAKQIYVELDALEHLTFPVIRTAIAILRDARERDTAVIVRTTRASIVRTLQLNALDKLFTIEPVPAPESGEPSH